MFPGAQHLQNLHPLVVHFPIAYLCGAALFYFLAWVCGNDTLATTAFSLLLLGTIAVVVAVATGLYAETGVMVSRSVRTHLLNVHRHYMLAVLWWSIGLASWAMAARPFPKKGRSLFLILCVILVALMMKGADYGGRMVYDYNAGGAACPQPIEFSR